MFCFFFEVSSKLLIEQLTVFQEFSATSRWLECFQRDGCHGDRCNNMNYLFFSGILESAPNTHSVVRAAKADSEFGKIPFMLLLFKYLRIQQLISCIATTANIANMSRTCPWRFRLCIQHYHSCRGHFGYFGSLTSVPHRWHRTSLAKPVRALK